MSLFVCVPGTVKLQYYCGAIFLNTRDVLNDWFMDWN